MKGLFIKDIKAIWKAVIFCIIMIFLESPICKVFEIDQNESASIIIVAAFIVVLCGVIPVLTLSDDDRCGFMKYAKVLPVNKNAVIGEKYILSLVVEVIFIMIGMINVSYICGSTNDLWWILYVIFPIGLVINGILLLCITKFGTEEAILIAIVTFIVIIVMIIGVTGYIDTYYVLETVVRNYRAYILVCGLLLFALSYFVTTKVYSLKEY